jgi:hypothetical protein
MLSFIVLGKHFFKSQQYQGIETNLLSSRMEFLHYYYALHTYIYI